MMCMLGIKRGAIQSPMAEARGWPMPHSQEWEQGGGSSLLEFLGQPLVFQAWRAGVEIRRETTETLGRGTYFLKLLHPRLWGPLRQVQKCSLSHPSILWES